MNFVDLSTLALIWYIIEWLLRILAVFVVPRNRRPTSGIAWLMFIFLIPVVGWLLFALIGSNKLPRHRQEAQQLLDDYVAWQFNNDREKHPHVFGQVPRKYSELSRLAESLTHLPVLAGNTAEPLADYDGTITRIIEDVDKAKKSVYVEYYIMALDRSTEPLFNALARAVKRGVDVRVMYDAYGQLRYSRRIEMRQRFNIDGIRHKAMLPLSWPGRNYTRIDLRNHRKVVVIDGQIGYTGSQNMIARNYHRKDDLVYDELVVRLEGPVVLQLEAVFFTDWHAETGELPTLRHNNLKKLSETNGKEGLAQILPSGPGYQDENNLKLFSSLMYDARKSITIVNPYLVPSESLILAITSAARRGVEVTVINSERIDQRVTAHAQKSYYDELLRAGVKIYLHRAPRLLHSKYILVDDDIVMIGSSNMDIRSFELNNELTLISYDAKLVREMVKITNTYLERSDELTLDTWRERRWGKQLLDNLGRLTSSLQ